MADEIVNVAGSKLIPISELLVNDSTLQFALAILVVGIVTIVLLSRKLSSWIDTKKFRYHRPYMTKLAKNIMLPLFALVLIVSITTYIQVFELFDSQIAIDEANADEALTPRETFAKILYTFVVFIIGYTVAPVDSNNTVIQRNKENGKA